MSKIISITSLIETLKTSSVSEMQTIYKQLEIPESEFEPYLLWDKNTYTRNCIFRNENFELLVLCWDKGEESSIHFHNDQECWLYNIIGEFKELRYDLTNNEPQLTDTFNLECDQFSYMSDDMGLHRVVNVYDGKSASLHLYAKPIDECKHYDEQTKSFQTSELSYHSYNGELTETIN